MKIEIYAKNPNFYEISNFFCQKAITDLSLSYVDSNIHKEYSRIGIGRQVNPVPFLCMPGAGS